MAPIRPPVGPDPAADAKEELRFHIESKITILSPKGAKTKHPYQCIGRPGQPSEKARKLASLSVIAMKWSFDFQNGASRNRLLNCFVRTNQE
jgi:hypothetical protein